MAPCSSRQAGMRPLRTIASYSAKGLHLIPAWAVMMRSHSGPFEFGRASLQLSRRLSIESLRGNKPCLSMVSIRAEQSSSCDHVGCILCLNCGHADSELSFRLVFCGGYFSLLVLRTRGPAFST